ncbi:energy transducer TonB [Alteromonas sp. 1_MG-2023]|uniref:energy transducer TonB n=1 Tax=Alteromonas sp. 1_MG-2023 TaxID=3062669 RepID=UPI0026E38236|nr:energy transducer TonB [Alteromonas sp. 1_MG-2023]MDO6475703.1 energy transducer TonB [Alteromonas sp. 1_MG-2023]
MSGLKRLAQITLFSSLLSMSAAADEFSEVYRAFQEAVEKDDIVLSTALAKQAWQLGQQKYGADSENAVKLRHSYANMLAQQDYMDDAVSQFKAVLEQYDSLYDENSPALLNMHIDILNAVNKLKGMDKAKVSFSQRLSRYIILNMDDIQFEDDAQKVTTHYLAATVVIKSILGVTNNAILRFYKDNLSIVDGFWGDKDLRTLESRLLLALVYERFNHSSKAIGNYEIVADTFDSNLDFSHPYALNAHAKLVGLYEKKGESDKATEHCRAIGKMKPWSDDQEPEPLYRVNPDYPVSYARRGKDGSAVLSFTIDDEGFVRDIELIETDGGSMFGTAAIKALEHWRYAPRFVGGNAVATKSRMVRMDFKLG